MLGRFGLCSLASQSLMQRCGELSKVVVLGGCHLLIKYIFIACLCCLSCAGVTYKKSTLEYSR